MVRRSLSLLVRPGETADATSERTTGADPGEVIQWGTGVGPRVANGLDLRGRQLLAQVVKAWLGYVLVALDAHRQHPDGQLGQRRSRIDAGDRRIAAVARGVRPVADDATRLRAPESPAGPVP